MENTYSKNSSVIPGKFNIYRSCIKSSIVVFSGISFIRYGQNQKIGKINNVKIFGRQVNQMA
jgi:hypothetical protein